MGLEREIVACVGSSSTAARGTYDWIAELEKRPRNERFSFRNFGVGGDLLHNVVSRLDAVAAAKPDHFPDFSDIAGIEAEAARRL